MNRDEVQMSCAEFQSQLPDLIGAGRDVRSHPHVKACALCRELVDDLHRIAEQTAKGGHFQKET
jgi:hypothetical protein